MATLLGVMKIYTTHRIRTGPGKWAVAPISTKFEPAPRVVAVYDVEDEALADASRRNLAQVGVTTRLAADDIREASCHVFGKAGIMWR